VFFGGESGPALRRVAEYGNGWVGFNLTAEEAAAKIKRLEELLKANGRRRSDVEIAVRPRTAQITSDDLKRYRDGGVDELVLGNVADVNTEREIVSRLEQVARDWVEPAAKL
jgi:alkanesulfonate monooxygenase SsuD/methylene tetrahydromethanopterin reductase-like flavin-dependent oxidoreductase (luciferase family)